MEVIDRATAMNESLMQRISRANFVYLSGGDPHYLYRTLEGTLAWTATSAVLKKGGLVAGWVVSAFKTISFSRPTFVGIERHTALVASEGKLQVLGTGGVTIWGRGIKMRYEGRLAKGSPSETS